MWVSLLVRDHVLETESLEGLLEQLGRDLLQPLDDVVVHVQQYRNMSSYIIAGSADSFDTAYCEEIARRIQAKYKNIDFRVVIKHPSEWEDYLNQICRIYGFPKKSNPIIYTYHGKIIGNKEAFLNSTVKYFGLAEDSLTVTNLSIDVNVKLANEELQRKKVLKNNLKTLQERIAGTYDRLLKAGTLKHEFKESKQFLVNGIEYLYKEVQGACPAINFAQHLEVKVEQDNIEASDINLLALSLQDQIPAEEPPTNAKEAFVTSQNNNNLNSEAMEKMSEASKTNRLHSSVMSKDEDSKANNKDSSQDRHKIDEQFDDLADYVDINMEDCLISELGDNFSLAFWRKKVNDVPGEMVLYYNEAGSSGNVLRMYNDGRPVIGHHNIVKEVYFNGESINQNLEQSQSLKAEEEDAVSLSEEKPEKSEQQIKKEEEPVEEAGSHTENNIPEVSQQPQSMPTNEDAFSEHCSDLNLISNLNYHTLYIQKPLSLSQIRYILHVVRETNAVSCLEFLPENSNPRIKVYSREMLLEGANALFPVESFIEKQIEDGEYESLIIPRDEESGQSQANQATVLKINGVGFHHLYYPHSDKTNEEELAKVLRAGINELLFLEEDLKKQIGYNIIITRKYTLIVALAAPYRIYGPTSLYYDGLAFLGYVRIAKVVEGYMLKAAKIDSGAEIRNSLAKSSGFVLND